MRFPSIILLISLILIAFGQNDPDAPLWPETFSQDYIQSDSSSKVYTSGKIFYDFKNNRQRMDLASDFNDAICQSISKDTETQCSQIIVNDVMYVNLPDKNLCCKCCTAAQGCTVEPRDWLKDFKFSGQVVLNEDPFYKWTFGGGSQTENYYATEDELRIPRRIEADNYILDFITRTYSTDTISDSVFQLPSNCVADCPKDTMCGSFSSKKVKYQGFNEILLKRFQSGTKKGFLKKQ